MKIVGITGGTGAGKSTVCEELKKNGAKIIDADAISRMVTKNGGAAFDEVVESFGTQILDENGEINRRELAEIVFSNCDKLKILNTITHKHIFAEMQRQLNECRAEIAVLDVPLLFNKDFPIKCDITVAIVAEPEVRLNRIMARDGIDRRAAEARINNQISNEEYSRLADLCVENNGGTEDMAAIAKMIINEIRMV